MFSDKLRLQAVFPKPALIYEPNDDWQFKLLGELNYLGVRTDDVVSHTEHKLDLHDAVLQYSEYRAGVQVGYSGIKHLKLSVGAGCTVERDFDFFRAHQAKQSRSGAVRQDCSRSEILRKNFAELSGDGLVAANL